MHFVTPYILLLFCCSQYISITLIEKYVHSFSIAKHCAAGKVPVLYVEVTESAKKKRFCYHQTRSRSELGGKKSSHLFPSSKRVCAAVNHSLSLSYLNSACTPQKGNRPMLCLTPRCVLGCSRCLHASEGGPSGGQRSAARCCTSRHTVARLQGRRHRPLHVENTLITITTPTTYLMGKNISKPPGQVYCIPARSKGVPERRGSGRALWPSSHCLYQC